MVGDWVSFKDHPVEIYRTNAIGIVSFYGHPSNIDYSIDDIEPIRITGEILTKNGFKYVERDQNRAGRYVWSSDGKRDGALIEVTIYNPPATGGVKYLVGIFTECTHDSGINRVHNCDIEYVHELQHAIKLCKIDKEIYL